MIALHQQVAFKSLFVLLVAGVSIDAVAQSPSGKALVSPADQVPVNNLREPSAMVQESMGSHVAVFGLPNPNPPHLVLEVPRPRPHAMSQHGMPQGMVAEEVVIEDGYAVDPRFPEDAVDAQTPASHVSKHKEKLKNQFLHGDKQEAAVAIPGANRMPVWKTPYSYGHFGASRNRQWTKHRGHQDSYLQWTLR